MEVSQILCTWQLTAHIAWGLPPPSEAIKMSRAQGNCLGRIKSLPFELIHRPFALYFLMQFILLCSLMILITNFCFMLKTASKKSSSSKDGSCLHFILKLDLTFLGLVGLLLIKAGIIYYADRLYYERHAVIRQDLKCFRLLSLFMLLLH